MGAKSRTKGARIEREIIERLREIGVAAERVPLSGASHYKGDAHDVDVYAWGRDEAPLVAEVKGRKDGAGFKVLERWLGEYDLLFLRRDRDDPMVAMPWRVLERLIGRGNFSAQQRDATCAKPVAHRDAGANEKEFFNGTQTQRPQGTEAVNGPTKANGARARFETGGTGKA
jgi:Holliday junction resolvase